MFAIKPGARLGSVSAICALFTVVRDVFSEHGAECILTSGMDSLHRVGSLHYIGHAFDFRSHHIDSIDKKKAIAQAIRIRLGDDYDVILEKPGEPNEHFHVEWQPKRPR